MREANTHSNMRKRGRPKIMGYTLPSQQLDNLSNLWLNIFAPEKINLRKKIKNNFVVHSFLALFPFIYRIPQQLLILSIKVILTFSDTGSIMRLVNITLANMARSPQIPISFNAEEMAELEELKAVLDVNSYAKAVKRAIRIAIVVLTNP